MLSSVDTVLDNIFYDIKLGIKLKYQHLYIIIHRSNLHTYIFLKKRILGAKLIRPILLRMKSRFTNVCLFLYQYLLL